MITTKKTALIVIDLQNCFINNKTKDIPKQIKKHIESQTYDFIVFSKFINEDKSNFVKKLNRKKCKKSPETDVVSELYEIASKNYIFEKNTYSLFKSKKFNEFLKQNKISKLFFCGVDIDACILASWFEAFDLGFDFEILTKLTGSSAKIDITNSAKQIIKHNLQY